jgi:hypothetical protein
VTGDPGAEPTGADEAGRAGTSQPSGGSDAPDSSGLPGSHVYPGESPDTVPLAPVAPVTPLPRAAGSEPAVPAVPSSPRPASPDGGRAPASYGPPSYGTSPYGPPGFGGPGYPGPGYPGSGYGGPGYGQAGMRAAAADRERTIDILKAAYGEGRLTREEFETRTAKTMSARYYGDLTAIVADLPSGPLGLPIAYQPGYYPPVHIAPTNGLAVGALVCGILEFFTLGVAAIPAVILGHMAHGQIKRTGERGDGMAITGMVLGWMAIAGWALFFLILSLHR